MSEISFTAEEKGVLQRIGDLTIKLDELELKVKEVSRFHPSSSNARSSISMEEENGGEKDKEKDVGLPPKDTGCRKRMQELMRQFGTILRQISQHKWAWPFLQPVDVKGLDLHDYFDIIKKPMDFETIRKKMEMKDGNGYKNVRQIYADVRLVFSNAMIYNNQENDVHHMARTLLEKFEEKWLQFLPKVVEEENRLKMGEANAPEEIEMAQKAAKIIVAKETAIKLLNIYHQLDDLKETLLGKCRKMTTEEKRKLASGLSQLSPEDLATALEIIAQNDPTFQAAAEEVDLDMDAMSDETLWRLTFFVKKALGEQGKGSATKSQESSKRKKEIIDALAKTQKRRTKKAP